MISPENIASNLIKESRNPRSPGEISILLQQLHEAVQVSSDVDSFIGPIMKLLPNNNFEIKRSVYSLLPRICSIHPDSALLAANTIVKDCMDPNPYVKCVALSAACSLPQILEHTNSVLLQLFDDDNPKVRHSIVLGSGKLFRKAPDFVKEMGYVDRLYECVRDSDPVVVTSSLLTLDVILASEGGVVVNRNMVNYLMGRLPEFPDMQLADILQVFRKYTPASEEELFREMSILDPYLTCSTNAAVTVSCINLFLFLVEKDFSHLTSDIIKRSLPVLREFLKSSASKLYVKIILDFLISMIHQKKYDWLNALSECSDLFFPQEKDDYKIIRKKISILPYVCDEENYKTVLEALKEKYCLNMNTYKDAIMCASLIAKRCSVNVGHECLKIFHTLLELKSEVISDSVLNVLHTLDLLRYDRSNVSHLLHKVFTNAYLIHNVNAVPAMAVLLGDYGEFVDNHSAHVLESLVQDFEVHEDERTKLLILMASVKMFLKMPAKCQHILGEVFEKCMSGKKEPDDLFNKARRYYLLLQHDVELAKKILLGC
ncbi:hypothetical protein R5R35_013648 [Gryllus longicercus]|uniref:Clathrin/coatomer adaptor adaptin-like N-terminal domain-containing protein n=1 Tax=Gryllus longicercus TaxID=2509291 RepID=A0AAN9VUJ1_9ORTH